MERNKITVNGKSLTQLEAELAEYLPARMLKYNEDGYAYFPVVAYESRFIEVVGGRRWFNIATTPPRGQQGKQPFSYQLDCTD